MGPRRRAAASAAIVLGVPGTYPPRPLNGVMVTCFLTPSTREPVHVPAAARAARSSSVVGEYLFDCTNFRTEDKDDLLRQVYEMTDRRFALADHLLETKPWELFAMVEMGTDRIHHGFWKDMDPSPPQARAGRALRATRSSTTTSTSTACSARLLEHADDETAVLVVSDHGAKRMDGGIRINEWLRQRGPASRTAREPSGALALARRRHRLVAHDGLGRGRLLRARLPQRGGPRAARGRSPPADYERFRDELAERLAAIPDDRGEPIATQVYRPEEVYAEVNGVAPDLIVYFGDLYWRAVGTVGGDEGIYTFDNDTGPDDANHAQDGLLIMAGAGHRARACARAMHLLDVAPTVLELLGLAAARDARDEPAAAARRAQQAALTARLAFVRVAVLRVPVRERDASQRGARPGRGRRRRPRRSAAWSATRFQRPGPMRHSSVSRDAAAAGVSLAVRPPPRREAVSLGRTVDELDRRADLAGRDGCAQLAAAFEPNGRRVVAGAVAEDGRQRRPLRVPAPVHLQLHGSRAHGRLAGESDRTAEVDGRQVRRERDATGEVDLDLAGEAATACLAKAVGVRRARDHRGEGVAGQEHARLQLGVRGDDRVRDAVHIRDPERVAPGHRHRFGLRPGVGQRERRRPGQREAGRAEREPGRAEQRELDEPLPHDLIPFLPQSSR